MHFLFALCKLRFPSQFHFFGAAYCMWKKHPCWHMRHVHSNKNRQIIHRKWAEACCSSVWGPSGQAIRKFIDHEWNDSFGACERQVPTNGRKGSCVECWWMMRKYEEHSWLFVSRAWCWYCYSSRDEPSTQTPQIIVSSKNVTGPKWCHSCSRLSITMSLPSIRNAAFVCIHQV